MGTKRLPPKKPNAAGSLIVWKRL